VLISSSRVRADYILQPGNVGLLRVNRHVNHEAAIVLREQITRMVYIRHEKKEPILTSHCHWKTVDLPKRTVPIYATKHISQWSFTVVNNARSVIQTLRDKQGTWLRDFDYTEMLKAAPVIYVEIVTQQLTNFLRALGPKLGYLSFVFLTANWTDDLHFKYETTTAGDDYLARAVQVVLRDHPGSNFHLLDGISDELRAYWKRVCGGEESEKDVKSKLQITLGERKGCPTGVRWQLSPSTRKVARQFFTYVRLSGELHRAKSERAELSPGERILGAHLGKRHISTHSTTCWRP